MTALFILIELVHWTKEAFRQVKSRTTNQRHRNVSHLSLHISMRKMECFFLLHRDLNVYEPRSICVEEF
jgi:hypothetical protein